MEEASEEALWSHSFCAGPHDDRPDMADDNRAQSAQRWPETAHRDRCLQQQTMSKMARSIEQAAGRALDSWEELDAAIQDVLRPDPPCRVSMMGAAASVIVDETGDTIRWPWEDGYSEERDGKARTPSFKMPCDDLIERAMRASMADGNMGENSTGVREWKKMCLELGIDPVRPLEAWSSLKQKLAEEQLCMQFVATLVEGGRQPSTAANYFGQVQGWHAKTAGVKLCGGIKLARLPAMVKGMKKIVKTVPPKLRRGLAAQALGRAMEMCLSKHCPADANVRAALAVAFQGLLRSAEFAYDGKGKIDLDKLPTRADVKVLNRQRLVMMMRPCKNMRHLNGKTVPLVIAAGGTYVDAVAEMINLRRVDPHGWSTGAAPGAPLAVLSTPLFRVPSTNKPLTTDGLRDKIKYLMRSIGEDSDQFGTHSLRIGGATALFAAGASPEVIRTMGRWSSDCYRLYVRACFQQSLSWTRVAGSTRVHDLHAEFDEVDSY